MSASVIRRCLIIIQRSDQINLMGSDSPEPLRWRGEMALAVERTKGLRGQPYSSGRLSPILSDFKLLEYDYHCFQHRCRNAALHTCSIFEMSMQLIVHVCPALVNHLIVHNSRHCTRYATVMYVSHGPSNASSSLLCRKSGEHLLQGIGTFASIY